jgi:hypothetical protein
MMTQIIKGEINWEGELKEGYYVKGGTIKGV